MLTVSAVAHKRNCGSDNGYLLIQAFFQALQSYSWGFALIQSLSKRNCDSKQAVNLHLSLYMTADSKLAVK